MAEIIQPAINAVQAMDDLAQQTRQDFMEFLETFKLDARESEGTESQGDANEPFYLNLLRLMVEEDSTVLEVDFDHIKENNPALATVITDNFHRFEVHLRSAVQGLVRKYHEQHGESEDGKDREFWVSICNAPAYHHMRELKVEHIGKLCAFKGTVTRTSEVRPELFLGTFRCLECQTIMRNIEQQFRFTTPCICTNASCQNRTKWQLIREESTFIDWQRVRVQESSDEVPPGSLPRTMDVILRNMAVEGARAGDKVIFNGSLIVVPDVAAISTPGERVVAVPGTGAPQGDNAIRGLKSLGVRELTYKLCFLGNSTQQADKRAGTINIRGDEGLKAQEVLEEMSPEERREVERMRGNRHLYSDIVSSLAPGVFGAADVKKAMLLMLMGGVHKSTREKTNLRGDINIIIVGDPSCGKSQLLKYISRFLPRAVYTSGKASSAAGLTATVVKEPETNDYCIEAGALMLADNGICCIDEFDKMDVKDQVAIHEAMEQQTISIAKAGIQATLNARTSVFAAANPKDGQYDRSKALKYNINLPPAIMSRFDLVHVMIDEPDEGLDQAIARHIVNVHQKRDAALAPTTRYTMEQMQRYIKYARAISPRLSEEAREALVESYKRLRSEDAAPGSASAYRITVRQLEALIRLSEARARVDASDEVRRSHVQEATRLLKASIISVDDPDLELNDEARYTEDFGEEEWLRDEKLPHEQPDAEMEEDGGGPSPEELEAAEAAEALAAGPREEPMADAEEEAPPPAAAAAASQEAPPAKTKITHEKFKKIKGMMVGRLKALEETPEEGEAMTEDEKFLGFEVGTKQRDLVKWYVETLIGRGEIRSHEQAVEEIGLSRKVILHLVRNEAVLVEVSRPTEQREGETDEAFRKRKQDERVLALSPNFDPSA